MGRDQELILRPVPLNELVKRVAEALPLRPGVRLDLDLAGDLPRAHLDDKAAQRAVANVIKNAHEAAPDEGGRIAVSTDLAGGFVRVTVADNGPGIPEEKRGRMFEEFTTKTGGTGLGLLVVKKVMDQHRGEVAIESAPGGGTAVTLGFPVSKNQPR